MFEIADRLHELRCRETCWLTARREELVREQRRLRVEELAVVRVLDERGALDATTAADDGVSTRSLHETVETARALESLPRIAATAHAGRLSAEQLAPVTQLADADSDAEWAERAPNVDPAELARRARCQDKPTVEESRARRDAEHLRLWWSRGKGMLFYRGALADARRRDLRSRDPAPHRADASRPRVSRGQPFEQRAAGAFAELVDGRDRRRCDPSMRHRRATRPLLQIAVPLDGPGHGAAGSRCPTPASNSSGPTRRIEPVLVDDDGIPLAFGRRFPALSPKIVRAVLLRDGQCRCGTNCGLRHGLEVHHLVPRSWGGTDDVSNLVAVFAGHHAELVPHGPWALVGNPNQPDGLRRVLYTDLTAEEARRYGLPPPPGSTRSTGPSP